MSPPTPARPRSTIPKQPPIERLRRGRLLRGIFNALLAIVLLIALTGFLGVRTSEVSASGEGYEVTVTYASMTRPGLATPFAVEVVRPGGFTEPVTVAASSDFLDAFDENGLDPDPAVSRSDGDFVYWTLEPPQGNTLDVSFDARLEPAVQWKREGTVQLIRENRTLVELDFTMWVMP